MSISCVVTLTKYELETNWIQYGLKINFLCIYFWRQDMITVISLWRIVFISFLLVNYVFISCLNTWKSLHSSNCSIYTSLQFWLLKVLSGIHLWFSTMYRTWLFTDRWLWTLKTVEEGNYMLQLPIK